jgi:transcriptional regulator with XRE-family HTH domain
VTKEELQKALGIRLRARREELTRPLTRVARDAGLSFGFVSQLELGRNAPSLHVLYCLAKALDLSLVALFADIDAARPEPEKL